eukprot:8724833-Alexandrium_andersonii.AAC.1
MPEGSRGPELKNLYHSLLGAVVYLSPACVGAAVSASAHRRRRHVPQIIGAERLNALMLWIQNNTMQLRYKRMAEGSRQANSGGHLRIFSGATFKNEAPAGHCVRG